jgi:hypothetical protein
MKMILFVICFAIVFVSCQTKTEELIIGKWKASESNDTCEFTPDSTVIISNNGNSISGNYQFLDSYRLKLDLRTKGTAANIIVMRLMVYEKELVLIDPNGKIVKYHKAD